MRRNLFDWGGNLVTFALLIFFNVLSNALAMAPKNPEAIVADKTTLMNVKILFHSPKNHVAAMMTNINDSNINVSIFEINDQKRKLDSHGTIRLLLQNALQFSDR